MNGAFPTYLHAEERDLERRNESAEQIAHCTKGMAHSKRHETRSQVVDAGNERNDERSLRISNGITEFLSFLKAAENTGIVS